MFGSGLLMLLFYSAYDLLWTYTRDRVWYLPVSSWISALVLAIVALPKPPLIFIILLPFLAVAAKQLFHFGKNRHVFNPAAGALALAAIFTPAVSWWGVAAARFDSAAFLLFFIIGAAIIILWRQNRWHITLSFFIAYLFFLGVLSLSTGATANQLPNILFSVLLNGVLIFFATVMLIEPVTSTFTAKRQEIFYGALVGGAAVAATYLARRFNLLGLDPLIYGLLAGNLIASILFLPAHDALSVAMAGGPNGKKVSTRVDEPSYWFRDVPDKTRFPAFSGNREFDAVIIGGGMAGVSVAYFLAKAGKKVAVLEAGTIGSGDSGYTTACATRFLETEEATLRAWDSSVAAVNLFKKIIAEEKIDCDWQAADAVGFTRQADKKSLADFFATVRRLQIKDAGIELLDKPQASRAMGVDVSAAYRLANADGIFHMRKFLLALAERAAKYGALFFENSEVVDVTLGEKVVVKTKEGSIAAPRLIVASGFPSVKFFPAMAKMLQSSVSYIIDVKFSGKIPLPAGFFWDDLTPYHYYRSVGKGEFLLGGEDWILAEPKPAGNPHEKLAEWLKDLTGGKSLFKVINSWQGSIFSTPDGLPLIGPHPAYGKNVIFLTGWAGNGTAQGFFGGNIAADLITNEINSFHKLFACDRIFWPEANKLSMSKDLDNLEENKGIITEVDGQKLAVVKTQEGVKTFSAICPHLGCEVGWNDDDKTWDCPCHGSRFKADGSLMHGPAKRGLDKVV